MKPLGAMDQFQPVSTSCEDPTANGLSWIKDGATTVLTTETCSAKVSLQGTALPVEPTGLTAGDVHPARRERWWVSVL